MSENYIIYEVNKKKKICTITFNRPDKLNAVDFEARKAIPEAFYRAEEDEDVKVIIVKGAGSCFGSGMDANLIGPHLGIGPKGSRRASMRARLLWFKKDYGALGWAYTPHYILKPVIAQIHGYCYGGHFEFMTSCDIGIASEDARFTHPGYRMIGPLAEGLVLLYLSMGVKQTKEMMLTGRALDADEALRYGLINKVVPKDKLEETVMEEAEAVARQPFDALVMGKKNLETALDLAGWAAGLSTGPIAHALATNIRYEEGEWNMIGERGKKGLGEALKKREQMYGDKYKLGK